MTICFHGYEGDSKTYPGFKIKSTWANNGLFGIDCIKEEPEGQFELKGTVSVLPSELKAIIENGDWEGEADYRPCLFPIKGRVYSRVIEDKIEIVNESVSPFSKSKEMKKQSSLAMTREDWQAAFDGLVAERDKVTKEMGGMIQPLVGKTSFTEESKVH